MVDLEEITFVDYGNRLQAHIQILGVLHRVDLIAIAYYSGEDCVTFHSPEAHFGRDLDLIQAPFNREHEEAYRDLIGALDINEEIQTVFYEDVEYALFIYPEPI